MRHSLWGVAASFVLFSLAGACGGSAGSPPPPAAPKASRPPPSESLAALEGSSATKHEPSAPDPNRCYAGCAKHIENARVRTRRARGLAKTPKANELFTKAGEAWVIAWRGCNLSLPDGPDRGCEHASEVLPQMIEAFEGSGRLDRRVFAQLLALDSRFSEAGSPHGSQAAEQLRELATRIENPKTELPKEHAADILAAAVYARLKLGEVPLAHKALRRLAQRHPGSEQASLAAAALAEHHNDAGQPKEALAALAATTRPSAKAAGRVHVVWHAARGRALMGLGRTAAASADLKEVLRRHRAPGKDDVAEVIGHAEPRPMLGRERVVEAVGAAHFGLAEPLGQRAQKLSMPRYRGPATTEGVNTFVKTHVAQWIAEKQQRLSEAVTAYQAVMDVQPVPPPRWVVAAAARVGQLWAGFAEDFEKAPTPPAIANDPKLRRAYQGALLDATEPLVAKARRAFEVCEDTAERFDVKTEHASECSRWLSAHAE